MFSTDTTGTNLLEFLFAEGYDVWLMDSRASMMLPAAPRGSGPTLDDLAQKDWAAAVKAVLDATRPGSVQVVAHDLGAITLSMALLGGLSGVRSAVLSQVATHLVTPRTPAGKVPACSSDVCTHLMAVYRPLYEHAQLDKATHDSLFELFGDADPALVDALAAMARKGHVVDAAGNDTYLAHLERMAIPIRFVHGEKNLVYLPESTAQARGALAQKNGPKLYSRVEIPGYGHYDCMFGKDAARDVFPHILEHLEET
jgi:cholesterol oxidase